MKVQINDPNLKNYWLEKYRPQSLDEIVLDENTKMKMKEYIDMKDIPHLLFYGLPGTGKTTISYILINALSDIDNSLIINGSDNRGIDTVRNIINPFLECSSMDDTKRIAFIDEIDGLTPDAQMSLKKIFEDTGRIGSRIIATCNDIHKIQPAIQSRFEIYYFKPLDDNEILKRCKYILDTENIQYTENDVLSIISKFKPDMRDVIKNMNKLIINRRLVYDITKMNIAKEETILQIILQMFDNRFNKNNQDQNFYRIMITKIHEIIGTDPERINYMYIFNRIVIDETIAYSVKIIINKYMINDQKAMIKSANFMAGIYNVIFYPNNI